MALKTKASKKKRAWFYSVRGSYLPANSRGWLSYIPFTGYLVFSLFVGTRDISKVWVATLFVLANWIAAGALMTMLAIKKS